MFKNVDSVVSFVWRNLLWIIGAIIAYIILGAGIPETQTVIFIALVEFLAIGLSGIALHIYTKVDFTEYLLKGDNKRIDVSERKSALVLLGHIFIGVHILVGLTVLGVYIAQFSH